jgi:hypothetical protein
VVDCVTIGCAYNFTLNIANLHSCSLSLEGVPHYIKTDDIFNGYLIPAGSIVMSNIWYTCPLTFTAVSGQLKLF